MNLLIHELHRVTKSKEFYLCLSILTIWEFIMGINDKIQIPKIKSFGFSGSLSLGPFSMIFSLILFILANFIINKITPKQYSNIKYTKLKIIFSKVLILFLIYFIFLLFIIILTFIINVVLFHKLDLTSMSIFNHYFITFISGDIINKFLILSIFLFIISIIKSTYKSFIIIAIIFSFISDILSLISTQIIISYPWFKWNPFNLLLVNQQLLNYNILGAKPHLVTLLTNSQIIWSSIICGIIFYILAIYFLNKRNLIKN